MEGYIGLMILAPKLAMGGERERHLYFPVVTSAHYGTKTPPDQQPTKLCAGVLQD